jgi:hypothetical protein
MHTPLDGSTELSPCMNCVINWSDGTAILDVRWEVENGSHIIGVGERTCSITYTLLGESTQYEYGLSHTSRVRGVRSWSHTGERSRSHRPI